MGTFEDNPKGQPTRIPASAWKVLAVLSSLATMVMYAETMLIPALPDLIDEFNVSYSTSSWILSAYLIPGAVMTPIAGKLSDIYGRKKVLLVIMAVYAVGIAMAGFAESIYFLFLSRAIQGIGIAMFVIAFSIIRDQFPRDKISIGQGIISSMFASGAVIGLLMGGFIISNFGWRATFLSAVPITIVLFLIIWRFNYNAKPPADKVKQFVSRTVDIKGAITLAVFVTSFLLALTLLETGQGFNMASVTAFLTAGVLSLGLFIVVERRSKEPLVDLRLIVHKVILPANLIIMVVGFSMFMVFQTIPVLVRNPIPLGFGGDATSVGYTQLPFAIGPPGLWTYIRSNSEQVRLGQANNHGNSNHCCGILWSGCIPWRLDSSGSEFGCSLNRAFSGKRGGDERDYTCDAIRVHWHVPWHE